MQPHKHAEVIKAWADGATVEWRIPDSDLLRDRKWTFAGDHPNWRSLCAEFRIKPTTTDEQTDDATGIVEVSE